MDILLISLAALLLISGVLGFAILLLYIWGSWM